MNIPKIAMFKIISKPDLRENPYISVVVTAYNRKEFILEAVQSVLNQTYDKQKYEIIVVKNYLDDEIDNFLKDRNVVNIYSDEKLLDQNLRIGIQEARGKIISFLDDDDVFFPFKLEEVSNVFSNDNVAYFRYEVIKTRDVKDVKTKFGNIGLNTYEVKNFYVSDLGSSMKLFKVQREFGLANMSSVSIKKELYLPFLGTIESINQMAEFWFFFLSILLGDDVLLSFGKKPLSIWRIHESWTNYKIDMPASEFLTKNLEISKDVISSYEGFINIISSMHSNNKNTEILIDTINIRLIGWCSKVKLIQGKRFNFKEIVSLTKTDIYLKSPYILLSALLAILSLLFPDFAGLIFKFGLLRLSSNI